MWCLKNHVLIYPNKGLFLHIILKDEGVNIMSIILIDILQPTARIIPDATQMQIIQNNNLLEFY